MFSMALAYRLGKSTVSSIIKETCKALWTALQPLYMKPPDVTDFEVIAKEFYELWNFPNCVGAVDGKHCELRCPPNSGSEYFNFHQFFSIILLAVADAKYRFIYVDIGAKGKENDSTLFSRSTFGKSLNDGRLPIPPPKVLPFSEISTPYVFIGDEAFPLKVNLMRPYPRYGQLTYEQKVFNYRLSRARRIIENAFGILTARFRVLRGCMNVSLETADEIIKASCVLHNYLMTTNLENGGRYLGHATADREVSGQIIPGTWHNDASLVSVGNISGNNPGTNAIQVRENFKLYFSDRGAVPWQRTSVQNGLY